MPSTTGGLVARHHDPAAKIAQDTLHPSRRKEEEAERIAALPVPEHELTRSTHPSTVSL